MTRFARIGGITINTSEIRCFQMEGRDFMIYMKDGSRYTRSADEAIEVINELHGKEMVVQVLPCERPMLALFERSETEYTLPVRYLGLCADGELRGLILDPSVGGFYTCESYVDKFLGLIDTEGSERK